MSWRILVSFRKIQNKDNYSYNIQQLPQEKGVTFDSVPYLVCIYLLINFQFSNAVFSQHEACMPTKSSQIDRDQGNLGYLD